MDHKKETKICIGLALLLILLGIVFKRVFDILVGLYACHVAAGGFLLLAAICYFFPDRTHGSEPPENHPAA
ncbi:MAG: hypothetical protein QF473_13530 [Planctomycetota bacterium]|nr:hypothetical protein [Planctomycetota bacterium]